nr:nucleocapsid protein [Liriomyza bunyavirus]
MANSIMSEEVFFDGVGKSSTVDLPPGIPIITDMNFAWIGEAIKLIRSEYCGYINSQFAYQGFDPTITKRLIEICQPDPQLRVRELLVLVGIVLTRGTSIVSKLNKMSATGKEMLTNLKRVYHLYTGPASGATANTITLSRILNAFPEVAFKYLEEFPNSNRPISVTTMIGLGYTAFPSSMRGGFFFNLIPSRSDMISASAKHEAVVKATLAYLVEENLVLTRNRSRSEVRDKTMVLSSILTYAQAAHLSLAVTTTVRKNTINRITVDPPGLNIWIQTFNSTYPSMTEVHLLF